MRSTRRRSTLRRGLLFGVLSGCFTSLASLAVSVGFGLLGLVAMGPVSGTICLLLAIFGVSSATVILAILAYESFCEP